MPSILLDHHIDEAARMRRDEPPTRHRWGYRPRHTTGPTVAQFVTAALPPPPATIIDRSSLGLGAPDRRPLRFDDLRAADPEWSRPAAAQAQAQAYADAENAYRILAPGAAVEADWRAADAKLRAVYALTGHVLTDIEVALARLAMAVSDLAVRLGRGHALDMALAPVAAQLAEVA